MVFELTLENYKMNENFDFSVLAQNSTSGEIKIDNSNRNSLEYRLMKGETEMIRRFFDKDIFLNMKELGYLRIRHSDNKLTATIYNTEIDYEGKHYLAMPLEISLSYNQNSYKFSEPGMYKVEFSIVYEFEGTEYKTTFTSDEFEVF